MAYEFSPDNVVSAPVSDGQGGQAIEFALGFDTETDLIVLMAVMLTSTDREDTLEFHFGIRKRIGDGPASEPDYSKETVDLYIPKQSRSIVKDLIREALISIIPKVRPLYITMETFYPNLSPEALKKYEALCGAIGICGYTISDEFRDETNGINYWVFSRK